MVIIVKRPENNYWELKEIDGSLKSLQEVVGGYIEVVELSGNQCLICNEEGMIRGLPFHSVFGRYFAGTVFVCGSEGEEFCDVDLDFLKKKGLIA